MKLFKQTHSAIVPSLAILLTLAWFWAQPTAAAEEKTPAPPYLMTEANGVIISVIWEEADIRKALPKGIRPVADMAGTVVMYEMAKGSGLDHYSSTYFAVNVEGYDSHDGSKANWMLQGVYGPDKPVAQALQEHYRLPVRSGSAKAEGGGDIRRYTGMIDGKIIVTAEIKSGQCEAARGFSHYLGFNPQTTEVILLPIPELGNWCAAEVKSFELRAPAGDPFSMFRVKSVVSVGEFRNYSFSFSQPRNLGKP